MRIKFLKTCEYKQLVPEGLPNEGQPCPERSKTYKEGETYDLPEDHARRWLRRNAAVRADAAKGRTEAMVPAAPSKG